MTTFKLRSAVFVLSFASASLIGCGEEPKFTPNPDHDFIVPAHRQDGGTDPEPEPEPEPEVETGGAESSAQIQAVLDTADGAELSLAIDAVAVTYVRPAIPTDPAGFFVQAEATGPAIFVEADPSTMDPAPVAGDIVSFKVTTVTTVGDQKRATAITDYARSEEGFDVASLAQDVSALDLPAVLNDYTSELITVSAQVTGDIYGCGGANLCAEITTTGTPAGVSALRFRTTQAVVDANSLRTGCKIAVGPTPLWRFAATAQPSAWAAEDVTASECPSFAVDEAVASAITAFQVTFETTIDAASVNAAAFTVSSAGGALAVTAAELTSPNTVTVTTAAQTPGTAYTVTVASTVTDTNGVALSGTDNTADFTGYDVPAKVVINEVAASAAGGCDLIELRVIESGSLAGFKVYERTSVVFEFPAGFSVATNDLIVIHMNRSVEACSGMTAGAFPADETTASTDAPAATNPKNFDGAFDFWSSDTGLTNTDNVFRVDAPTGAMEDVLFAANDDDPNAAAATETAAALVKLAEQWTSADGTVPVAPWVDQVFRDDAVRGLADATNSMQRTGDVDNNHKGDFAVVAPTFGALNVGQTAIVVP